MAIESDVDKIIELIKYNPGPLIDWEIKYENLKSFKDNLITDLINGQYGEELIEITNLDRLIYPEKDKINPYNDPNVMSDPPQYEIIIAVPKFNKSSSLKPLREMIVNDIKPLQIKVCEIQTSQEQVDRNSALLITKLNYILFKPTLDHKRCNIIKSKFDKG